MKKLLMLIGTLVMTGVAFGNIVINEIHYNPPSNQGNDDFYEFFELYNNGTEAVDIAGWIVSEGITHTFAAGTTISAGEYLVVAKDAASVETWYGITGVVQWESGNLTNGGEDIEIIDLESAVMDYVNYDDGGDWPSEPDGGGSSLELINPDYDNAEAAAWGASTTEFGTPGMQNSIYGGGPIDYPPSISDVTVIPEAPTSADVITFTATVTDDSDVDYVLLTYELNNDDNWIDTPMPNTIGDEYAVDLGPFANLTLVTYHVIAYDDTGQPATSGNESFLVVDPIDVLPVVINEIMQNPSAVSDGDGEYFELYNPHTTDVDLHGVLLRDDDYDTHVIDNANGSTVMPAGGYLVMGINGDFGTNGGVVVDYVYSGMALGNSGDELVLDNAGEILDYVAWDNGATFPDPAGSSMMLLDPALDNTLGENWLAATEPWGENTDNGTPGAENYPPITELDTPEQFKLHANYPNPFNPTTTIAFDIAEPATVSLVVFNLNGERVVTLVDEHLPAGQHEVIFDAVDLANGVYYYQLTSGAFITTNKMLLVK